MQNKTLTINTTEFEKKKQKAHIDENVIRTYIVVKRDHSGQCDHFAIFVLIEANEA